MLKEDGSFDQYESGLLQRARKYHSCGTFKSQDNGTAGFAIGGIGYNEVFDEIEISSVEMYVADVGEWVLIQSLPNPRYHRLDIFKDIYACYLKNFVVDA